MPTTTDISWKDTWRRGVAPLLSREQLATLKRGLEDDDPKLIQGATTSPPPLSTCQDWPVECGCPIAYAYAFEGVAVGEKYSTRTVFKTEDFFAQICFAVEKPLGELGASRHFLNWWDENPRHEVVPALLAEVKSALSRPSPQDTTQDVPREPENDVL